jgi:hypothetical protein
LFIVLLECIGGIEAKFSLGFLLGFYGRIVLLVPSKYCHWFLHWVVWATMFRMEAYAANPPSGRIYWICTRPDVPGAVGAFSVSGRDFQGRQLVVAVPARRSARFFFLTSNDTPA